MKICSNAALKLKQIGRINKLLSWNGFPKSVRNKLIRKYQIDYDFNEKRPSSDDEIESLAMKIPYMGPEGEKLVKTLKKKIKRNSSRNLRVRIIYKTTKISDFFSVKDKIPDEQKNDVIYDIQCPGCGEHYIGKTDCCFRKRMDEQGSKPDQPMFQHLEKCEQFRHIISLYALPNIDDHNYVTLKVPHISEAVWNNSKILRISRDWLELCYLETFLIKKRKPQINHGIKAAKELLLF